MPSIFDILKVIALGGALNKSSHKSELLSGIAAVLSLIVLTGVIFGAFIIGLLYILYSSLVMYSTLTAPAAAGLVIFLSLLIILSLALIIKKRIKVLGCQISKGNDCSDSLPVVSKITDITQSFIDGFLYRN
jgi:hypothetical protein